MSVLRRYPKRKAIDTAQSQVEVPDNLLETACSPLAKEEVEEWQGWVELESEPAFFNTILRDLGVKDVKTQELFTIDQSSLDLLPKPVFGLIFLYQYAPRMDEEQHETDNDSQIWFANQTTNNACATVALLNIIMNCAEVDLGERLQSFRAETKDLSTPMIGHSISNNSFIRAIHNSFTRRMDHLNVDLCLENDVSDAAKAAKRRASAGRGRKKAASKKKKTSRKQSMEYGFHFIAYVPSDGYVWELDGLMNNPHKIGPINPSDWTTVARPQIEARMLQYEEEQLSFNLLALCRSPLYAYSQTIASSLAATRKLQQHMAHNAAFQELISAEEPALDIDNETQLAEYHLTKTDMQDIDVSAHPLLKAALCRQGLETGDAYEIYQTLRIETKSAMGEFRGELMAMAEDEQRVKGRRRDYGSALHCWVKKLADKGVLEDIIKMGS